MVRYKGEGAFRSIGRWEGHGGGIASWASDTWLNLTFEPLPCPTGASPGRSHPLLWREL